MTSAERIIAHGYRRDHLHDHLLAASREPFTGVWPVWDREPRPRISGGRRRKAGALFLTVRFVRGFAGAPRSYAPRPWLENCRNRAVCDDICGGCCEPKSICEWAESGQGRTFFCERAIRRPKLDAAAINYFIATMACAENDGLNVFGCGRLIAGIGFLRLPASSTSGVTGVLTYARKPGGSAYASVPL